ncbi:MAG: acetolactate synthase large subunit, partial [Candidatus Hydrogenedentes bacterium]|nr:acetolactate synthase large subunit [Candidatus Hydrogenedentota bacterium]
LADLFGWRGMDVRNARDFKPALVEAFSAERPVLISVPTDSRENKRLSERLGKVRFPA